MNTWEESHLHVYLSMLRRWHPPRMLQQLCGCHGVRGCHHVHSSMLVHQVHRLIVVIVVCVCVHGADTVQVVDGVVDACVVL